MRQTKKQFGMETLERREVFTGMPGIAAFPDVCFTPANEILASDQAFFTVEIFEGRAHLQAIFADGFESGDTSLKHEVREHVQFLSADRVDQILASPDVY